MPNAYWKIVAFMPAGMPLDASARVTAVMMPNVDGVANDRWYEYRTSVAEIEAMIGYDIPAL